MEYNHFEDTGIFYANQEMVHKKIVLSLNTGLVYDIEDAEDVKIIKKVSDTFFEIAQMDIAGDGPCFFSQASIFVNGKTLIWEL